ncbi:3'-5' exonuclease [Intrasporangium sp.]|uniref:3'-5' exonuclease n=1 Tax=Intrasporangium sp. TaxID=1925024 RepID=UPI003221F372
MLDPQRSVLVDVETTDLHGAVCEIAVISPTGKVLLDTLVNPGCPIAAAATRVHGITCDDVAGAPRWEEVLPWLEDAVGGRRLVAYNAEYDRGAVALMSGAWHPLANPARWDCAMRARADIEGRPWCRLDGGHRALGDTFAMLHVLWSMDCS